MGTSELQETLQSYFPILEEESLNDLVKNSSCLKSTKGTKLTSEGKRHHYIYLIVNGRYKALLKDTPEILQRISLTDIASFLGVSRETLSRIRANK